MTLEERLEEIAWLEMMDDTYGGYREALIEAQIELRGIQNENDGV